jgi:HAD superfamily hydrolase (TIGR01490 family)
MNQNSNKLQTRIAVIDIDGTLIEGQIQQGLINFFYSKGELSLGYIIRLNAWFVLYKLHITDNVKNIFEFGLKYLQGKPIEKISVLVDEYIQKTVKLKIFPKSFELINRLRSNNFTIIILSTAVDAVVSKVTTLLGADDYISTRLEIVDGLYTGHIAGDIAYGEHKVDLLKEYLTSRAYSLDNVEAYADHESDIPMLRIVGKAYIVNPNAKMRRLSIENNFDTIDLRNP